MIKFVLFALVCYVLYRLFMNDKKKSVDNEAKVQKKRVEAGEMVQDPICGAYVDKENALTVRNGRQITYFCSYECRQKYLKNIEDQQKLH